MNSDLLETVVPIGTLLLGLGVGWAMGGAPAPPEPSPVAAVAAPSSAMRAEVCADKAAPLEARLANRAVRRALLEYELSEAWK